VQGGIEMQTILLLGRRPTVRSGDAPSSFIAGLRVAQ
jgi:hypothetical protein